MSVNGKGEAEPRTASEPGQLAAQFVALSDLLLDAGTVQEVLQRVVGAAQVVVDGADLVSITLRASDGRFHTPVETDSLATRLDELQYRLDEGPCVEATCARGMGVTGCPDLATGAVFPRWGPAAAALGVHSVLAVGLFPGGDPPRMGALNCYSFRPHGLDGADRDAALVLAAHASIALAATKASVAHELEAAQLRTALVRRDVIGQAKGILMERRSLSAEEAFDVLRAASQSLNVKLADIAKAVSERRAELWPS